MTGVTEEVLDTAETWLREHGHAITGIMHNAPGGPEAREMAALALHLNVFTASEAETCQLIVDTLAFLHSSGRVCRHVLEAAR